MPYNTVIFSFVNNILYLPCSTVLKFSPSYRLANQAKISLVDLYICTLCSFSQLIFDELVDFFEAGRLFSMFNVVVYQIQKRKFFDGSFAFSLHLRIVQTHQPTKPYFTCTVHETKKKQQLCIYIPHNPLDNSGCVIE